LDRVVYIRTSIWTWNSKWSSNPNERRSNSTDDKHCSGGECHGARKVRLVW